MGTVLGKINVETPKYKVLAKGQDYEVREYELNVVAEVTYNPSEMKSGKDGGFTILANYIGAFGKPNNIKAEHKNKSEGGESEMIAMTAPVITQESDRRGNSEKIAMTAPVITEGRSRKACEDRKMMTMQFVLPSKYSMDNVPQPTDPRVFIKEVPKMKYGVITFSGVADDSLVNKMLGRLQNALQKAGFKINGDHTLARYNPPWTPPFLRTNEILLPVE